MLYAFDNNNILCDIRYTHRNTIVDSTFFNVVDSVVVNYTNVVFDLTPKGIIKYLDLKKPIYKETTNYGHFGKEEMTWEKVIEL